MKKILAAIGVVLAGFACSHGQEIRPITQYNDLRTLEDDYYENRIFWFQGDSIRYDVYAREGNSAVDFTGQAFPVFFVSDATNRQLVYIAATGTVQNATNGHVRVTVPYEDAALETNTYASWMVVFRGEVGQTAEVATVAFSHTTVLPSPLGVTFTNQGITNGFTINLAGIVNETDPIFTASVARSINATMTGQWSTAYGWGDHAVAGYATGSPLYSVDLSSYATGSPLYTVDLSPYATGSPVYSVAGLATGDPLYEVDLSPYATGSPVYSTAGLATGDPLYEVDLSGYLTSAEGATSFVAKVGDTMTGPLTIETANPSQPSGIVIGKTVIFPYSLTLTMWGGTGDTDNASIRYENADKRLKVNLGGGSGAYREILTDADLQGDAITFDRPVKIVDADTNAIVTITATGGLQVGQASWKAFPSGDVSQDATNTATLGLVTAESLTLDGDAISDWSRFSTGSPLYEVDLSPYATGAPLYEVDLTPYATGSPLYAVDLSPYATGSPLYEVDLTPYATGSPVYSVSGLATGTPLYEVDLSPYATGTPVYSLSGLATGSPLYEVDLAPYATGTPIYSIAGLATGSPLYEVDLTPYATGTPLYEVDLTPYATGSPIYSVSGLATGSPLYEVDLSPYATGTPIYTVSGLATGSPLYEVDLTPYATGAPLYEVDLSGYATGTPIYTVTGLATGEPLYEIDLSPYATGSPVYSVSGLATGSPLYEVDLSGYATGTPLYVVDLSGYATGAPLYEVDLSPYATGTPLYTVDLTPYATGSPLYEIDLSSYATGTPIYSVSGLATGAPLYEVDLSPYATGTPVYSVAGLATGSPLYEVDLSPYATGTPIYSVSGLATGTPLYEISTNYWSVDNDGAGSGLDADKLDGQQASAFHSVASFQAYTTNAIKLFSGIVTGGQAVTYGALWVDGTNAVLGMGGTNVVRWGVTR
jgi:hypothetical protein